MISKARNSNGAFQAAIDNDGRIKAEFSTINKSAHINWKKERKCLYPGCPNKTIGSHTIQARGPIYKISESGHVLSPSATMRGIEIKHVGVNDASKFPGFCETHDTTLFSAFENKAKIENNHDAALQMYRSACREQSRLEFIIKHDEISINNIKNVIIDSSFEYALQHDDIAREVYLFSPSTMKEEFRTQMELDGRNLFNRLEYHINIRKNMLSGISNISVNLENYICGAKKFIENIIILDASLPMELPFAFSSSRAFDEIDQNGYVSNSHTVVMYAAPQDGQTKILICLQDASRDLFQKGLEERNIELLSNSPQSHANLYDLLEEFMFSGSDNWYMSPKYWGELSETTKHKIISHINGQGFSQNIPIEKPVFPELRKSILTIL
ncbi:MULTISPECIES: hypothetical protein [Nitrospirillum]|nr:hypothetical protein [Nitrospirillum amazonense]MEC4592402.1 hypothetical protein [Nitrospirillum amazonense]